MRTLCVCLVIMSAFLIAKFQITNLNVFGLTSKIQYQNSETHKSGADTKWNFGGGNFSEKETINYDQLQTEIKVTNFK